MRPVRTRRSFALRVWLAFGFAAVLTTSVAAAADAPGAAPLQVRPAAAAGLPVVAASTAYTDAGVSGLTRALAAETAPVAPASPARTLKAAAPKPRVVVRAPDAGP
ncbi:MAG TPA: hypothetical protein VEI48_09120, partial [Candidatus Sulfotelmatobacter sp.]|nr:hypothetical protein [Candidatus Sulfotelmatobacter sp.]